MKKFIYCLALLLLFAELEEIQGFHIRLPKIAQCVYDNSSSFQTEKSREVIAAHNLKEKVGFCIYIPCLCVLVTIKKEKRKILPENRRIAKYRKLCHKRLPRCSIDTRTYVRYNMGIAT